MFRDKIYIYLFLMISSLMLSNQVLSQKVHRDTVVANICEGSSYGFDGQNLSEGGFYERIVGQDSIEVLDLRLKQHYNDTIIAETCEGYPYAENGFNEDKAGFYTKELQTEFGCDSIINLILTVNPIYKNCTISAMINKGGVYEKFGFKEEKTGVYELKLSTHKGCDSIIYLDLTVVNIVFPNLISINSDNDNNKVFRIHNLIEQQPFRESELWIYNRQGKQIYHVKNISKDEEFWNPKKNNTPSGTYFYRFIGKGDIKVLDVTGAIEVLY